MSLIQFLNHSPSVPASGFCMTSLTTKSPRLRSNGEVSSGPHLRHRSLRRLHCGISAPFGLMLGSPSSQSSPPVVMSANRHHRCRDICHRSFGRLHGAAVRGSWIDVGGFRVIEVIIAIDIVGIAITVLVKRYMRQVSFSAPGVPCGHRRYWDPYRCGQCLTPAPPSSLDAVIGL